MSEEQIKNRMDELAEEGFRALYEAANDYHVKHSTGIGAAAMCVCGAGGGGSKACRALAIMRDLFRYADFEDPKWVVQFDKVSRMVG